MAIPFHPNIGTVLICDFSGFKEPEIVKRRPIVVIAPSLKHRDKLCTAVPLSTTAPRKTCDYHCQLAFEPALPFPYDEPHMWVKGDMLCTVSFDRLIVPSRGRKDGKRDYDVRRVSDDDLKRVLICALNGLGLGRLTPHL